jgi:magnesium transporter
MTRRNHRRPFQEIHVKRRTGPGAPPGTISADPAQPAPAIHLMAYDNDKVVEKQITEVGQIGKFLSQYPVTWVNVEGLGSAAVIEELGELFHLHRLALEDVVNVHQRAKVEEYNDKLFIVVRMAHSIENAGTARIGTEQVSIFVGKSFLLTFQEGHPGDSFDRVRARIRDGAGKMRQFGADYLAYALIDSVIDQYYPVLEQIAERIDQMEDAVLTRHRGRLSDELHNIKSDLLVLRRDIWPQRDAVALLARETAIFTDATRLYLRDCYDHVVQIVELVETYRELAADLRDLHMTSISNRINETMRVLTIIATIFIPLTFITSIYGMNFDTHKSPWNMPELEAYFGYPAVWIAMIATTIAMLVYFYRQGWIFRGGNNE